MLLLLVQSETRTLLIVTARRRAEVDSRCFALLGSLFGLGAFFFWPWSAYYGGDSLLCAAMGTYQTSVWQCALSVPAVAGRLCEAPVLQ